MEQRIELPDFEQIIKLVGDIKDTSIALAQAELLLDAKKAEINKKVVEDQKYFVNGKSPSQDYVKQTYLIVGLENELIPLRQTIIDFESKLEFLKRSFEIYKLQIEIWRTQSANERTAL